MIAAADPVPLSETVCGLPVALSVTDIVPEALPDAVGAKVTFIVQELATPTEPQLFVCEKPELAATPETVSPAVPLFVSVMG